MYFDSFKMEPMLPNNLIALFSQLRLRFVGKTSIYGDENMNEMQLA